MTLPGGRMEVEIGSMQELEVKLERIQGLLGRRSLNALLLERVDNFAWATCGAASYVNLAASAGGASLLITPTSRYLITDNIESVRLEQEEQLRGQGWEFRIGPWYEHNPCIAELTRGLTVGADSAYPGAVDLSGALQVLRANLTPEEGARFRQLGHLCAQAMDATIRAVRPGMTEFQISGLLAAEVLNRGVQPIVNLIATDQRVFHFRHPLPTGRRLEAYAMLVLCGRMQGLVCSITRLVHFGRLPDELRRRAEAVAMIDARLIQATRSHRKLSDVFGVAIEAYRFAGYADEWQRHHQGGLAGYAPREIIATSHTDAEVETGQAYAWNPSIAGTKSEDTILVGEQENEVLTSIPAWPVTTVMANGRATERPAILEVT
jgi:Xaa-Pro aminopeptidase